MLSIAAIAAASAMSVGQVHAADAVIVSPNSDSNATPHDLYKRSSGLVVFEDSTYRYDTDAVVVTEEDGHVRGESYRQAQSEIEPFGSEVVIVGPTGNRERADIGTTSDGELMIALDGEPLPAVGSRAPGGVYRLYDCSNINSTTEWDACEDQTAGDG
jgi:hypothetical protein